MFLTLLIISCLLFAIAYRTYGKFIERRCGINDERIAPSREIDDGVDFVPTKASILFGHHFSSIAGAGPIVGPILAATYFGWGPTWLWILVGTIFVGGVHDFGSAFLSVRNKGKSIAETTRSYVGENVGKAFNLFVIIALLYVIVVFLDLTAGTFAKDGTVATASAWYIAIAVAFGWVLLKKSLPFKTAVCIFVPLTFVGIAVGQYFPIESISKTGWIWICLIYCYTAAILPVNVLLQPRDFLSATFLYAMLIAGFAGVAFYDKPLLQTDFFTSWNVEQTGSLIPILFITVACGACSGFHSIVSSGTTSKQIAKESDIRKVNYGSMLVEGFLAVLALGAFMVLSPERTNELGSPVAIFANGMATFVSALGISPEFGTQLILLAVSTFLLTTLDTCTRLTRFLIEEFIGVRNNKTRYLGTLFVAVIPLCLVFRTINGQPIWKAIWPLFGATNQLLAALALSTFVMYLKTQNLRSNFALIPAIIMVIMPFWALTSIIQNNGLASLLGGTAFAMMLLGIYVAGMSFKTFFQTTAAPSESKA